MFLYVIGSLRISVYLVKVSHFYPLFLAVCGVVTVPCKVLVFFVICGVVTVPCEVLTVFAVCGEVTVTCEVLAVFAVLVW